DHCDRRLERGLVNDSAPGSRQPGGNEWITEMRPEERCDAHPERELQDDQVMGPGRSRRRESASRKTASYRAIDTVRSASATAKSRARTPIPPRSKRPS